MALTPEELALLTEEEREGLEDDELDGDDGQDDGDDGQQQDDGKGGEADGQDDGQGSDDKTNEEQPGRDDGQGADDAAAEDEPRAQPVPLIRAEVPADAKEKLEALDTREDELTQKFEDGDITTAEYRTGLRELGRERDDINWSLRKAELSHETTRAQAEQQWYGTVSEFLAEHPEIRKNELVYNAFDAVVRQITSDQANHGLSDRKQLEKAYKVWSESLGIAPAAKNDAKPAPKADAKPRREIPPTLAHVPAAEQSDTDDGKYAHLDRLMETDPMAFESALAKMPEHEQDAYLASR